MSEYVSQTDPITSSYMEIELFVVSLTVMGTLNDPFPGWIDNFNGPFGSCFACAKGFLRVLPGRNDAVMDFIPVDVVVKIICAAACQKAVCG